MPNYSICWCQFSQAFAARLTPAVHLHRMQVCAQAQDMNVKDLAPYLTIMTLLLSHPKPRCIVKPTSQPRLDLQLGGDGCRATEVTFM